MNIEYIKRSVKATLAIEGAKPSEEGQKITETFLKGEITSDQAVSKIIEYWGVKNEIHHKL